MDDPLEQLYPHLAPGDAADDLTGALSESIVAKTRESVAVKQAFMQAGAATLLAMSAELARAFRDGGRLLTMGNGGSSCDAAHVAVEFNHPVTTGRPALSAIHLGADIAMLTAVGNDVGFRDVFVRQVVAHGRAGDVLLGLSTSGNSENLLAAFARARRDGLATFGFAGGDGGKMAQSADVMHCLVVPTDSIHRVQECHVLAYHVLWDLVHTRLAKDR